MSRISKGKWILIGLVLGLALSPGSVRALQDPLNAQVRVVLPEGVETVAEAFEFFLTPYGYQITTRPPASPAARAGFRAAVPLPVPHDAVLTVKEALLAVTPEAWAIVIDHPNKLVSLMLRTERDD